MPMTGTMNSATLGIGGYRSHAAVVIPVASLATPSSQRLGGLCRRRSRFPSVANRVRAAPPQNRHWSPDDEEEPPEEEEEKGIGQRPPYHPFEEMLDSLPEVLGEARLSDAEMARTIIEVHGKAALLFSALINDDIQENIFWPDLSYLTDEHGDIYFEVKDDDDIFQTLNADDKLVQVIVGLDNIEKLSEFDLLGPSNVDFGIEDITNEDADITGDYEQDYISIIDGGDDDEDEDDDGDDDDYDDDDFDEDDDYDEDDVDSSESFGDWTNLETLKSSHPMYFAKKISEVVSSIHLDWMEQPPASLVIQGLLRPASVEESLITKKSTPSEKDLTEDSPNSGTSFYKLDIINIYLVTSYGSQSLVKIEDFRKAQPDVLVHSAAKIISRLKSCGDKVDQALKSLCLRAKGLHVEEVFLSGLDSLGFDLRVCSGTQVQTLRFSFRSQATSEYSAERQIHELLFPRIQHKSQQQQGAHQNE